MSKGQQAFAGQFAQFIDESVPGTYDSSGAVHILTCLKIDFQSDEAWDSFRPDGVSEDVWHAMSKEWRVATAAVRWDYAQMPVLLEMAIGLGVLTDPAPAGAVESGFALPAFGSRDIKVRTLEWGIPSSCERCTYCFITAISHSADRDAQNVDGQITFMCRKPVASGVAMTGQAAQNAVLSISAANVSTDGVFSVQKQGSVAESVTIHVGDSANTIRAAFQALNSIDGVTVVGSVTAASGELHTISGSGNNFTIYGDIVCNLATLSVNGVASVDAGAFTTSLQTAIRAKTGRSNAVLSGSVTAAVTGGTGYRITNAGTTSYNGDYFQNGDNLGGFPVYQKGTGSNARYLFHHSGYGRWYLGTVSSVSSDQIGQYRNFSGGSSDDNIAPEVNAWQVNPSASVAPNSPAPTVASVTVTPATGTANLTIQYNTGNGNVGDIEGVPGTGYVGTNTQPGNAGGSIAITVTNPTNTPILITNTSGAGWTAGVTTPGSDAKIRIPKRVPILPSHFGVRMATTRAGLAAAALVPGVKKLSWSIESLAEAVFFAQEGETSFQAHSDDPESRKTSWDLLLAASSSLLPTLLSKSQESPSAPLWIELREVYVAGTTLARWQGLVSVSAPRKRQAGGKVLAWSFTLTPVLDDAPFTEDVATLISDGGASFYAVARNAA